MATVTVAATPQFGVDDNAGSAAGLVPSVAVTSGETLLVIAINRQDAGQTAPSAVHGAASLTKLAEAAGDGINLAVFYATGLSGSQTVQVNFSGSTLWHVYAIRLLGTDQGTPFGTPVFNSSGSAGQAVSATTPSVVGGLVIAGVLVRDLFAATLAVDAGQTELLESTGTAAYASSTSSEPGAASVTSGWTWTGGIENRIVVVPVTPAAGGPVGRIVSGVIARQQRYQRR